MEAQYIKKDVRHWVIDYRSKGERKESQSLLLDVKQVIDDYLETDRNN